MATITRTIPRKLQRRRNDVRTKSDNLKYNGINIEGIKQSLKVGQTIQITHTERELDNRKKIQTLRYLRKKSPTWRIATEFLIHRHT